MRVVPQIIKSALTHDFYLLLSYIHKQLDSVTSSTIGLH